MSCRTTAAGSAWTTFARLESGLTDPQTLSTFHALRREGRGVPGPTQQQWAEFVAAQRAELANAGFSAARQRSLLGRLERAGNELPDGPSWYALRNIRTRAQNESNNINTRLAEYANSLGEDVATVRGRYHSYMSEVDRNRSAAAPEGYDRATQVARGVPVDHGTWSALERLRRESEAAGGTGPRRVSLVSFPNSSALDKAGYDPHDGRLEVVFRRKDRDGNQVGVSRTYAYRNVPAHVWSEMCTSGSIAAYNREVRNHSEYRYESVEAEEADATRRCGGCGQFWAPGHECPRTAPAEVPASYTARVEAVVEETGADHAEAAQQVLAEEVAAAEARAAEAGAENPAEAVVEDERLAEVVEAVGAEQSASEAEAALAARDETESVPEVSGDAQVLQDRIDAALATRLEATAVDETNKEALQRLRNLAIRDVQREVASEAITRLRSEGVEDTDFDQFFERLNEDEAYAAISEIRAEASAPYTAEQVAEAEAVVADLNVDGQVEDWRARYGAGYSRTSVLSRIRSNEESRIRRTHTDAGMNYTEAVNAASHDERVLALRRLEESARQSGHLQQVAKNDALAALRTIQDEEAIAATGRPAERTASELNIPNNQRYANRRGMRWGQPGYYDTWHVPNLTDLRARATERPVVVAVNYSGSREQYEYDRFPSLNDNLGTGSFRVTGQMVYDRPGRGQHNFTSRNLQCTCAAYRANYDCPHVRYVTERYQSQLAPSSGSRGSRGPVDPAVAQRAAEQAIAKDWMRDEEGAKEAKERQLPAEKPEDSYTNNFDAFEKDHDDALARKAAGESPMPFMTENATNGMFTRESGRGFGVELEFDFPSGVDRSTALRNIGRELHEAGLTSSPSQQGYHSGAGRGYTDNQQGGWSYEQDCTVSGEIVSPIMYDEPEAWNNLAKVCEIVKRNGGIANAKTGSHVHVGLKHGDTGMASELVRMANQHEDIMYRISQNPERPAHRPMRWCGPNSDVPQGGYDDISGVRYIGSSHGNGLNLAGVRGGENDHPEIRYWDGTLDPAVIQTQVKVSGALVDAAVRNKAKGEPKRGRESVGSHAKRLKAVRGNSRRKLTTDELRDDTATFRSFVDTLFTRREDKKQVTALFAVTKWQTAA